jgi:hypothetical protein
MSSHVSVGFAASESSEATTEIHSKDEGDPGMDDAKKCAIMF